MWEYLIILFTTFCIRICDIVLVRRIERRIYNKNAVKMRTVEYIQINVTIRRTLGSDVDASCGQLRNKYLENLKA